MMVATDPSSHSSYIIIIIYHFSPGLRTIFSLPHLLAASTIASLSQISSVIFLYITDNGSLLPSYFTFHIILLCFGLRMRGTRRFGGKLAGMEEELITAFEVFQIVLESGSSLVDRLRDLAVQHGLTADELSEHWVAYAANGSRELTETSCDEWSIKLAASKKGGVGKKHGQLSERKVYTKNDIAELFEDDLIGQYGALGDEDFSTQMQCGVKRSVEETTPPSSTHKVRVMENEATPTTPRRHTVNHSGHNGLTPSTPAGSYAQRKNSGAVACSLNERDIPLSRGRGRRGEVNVGHYDLNLALTAPYHHVFQKISDKALALLEWAEELGRAICHTHGLPEPLPLSQPSLEPAVYVGRVVCDGEGHLNPSSVLLEGALRPGIPLSHRVRLEIPGSSGPYSLFPGQVVAVEGVNTFSGALVPTTIYDQGVYPPLPKRPQDTIGGFTAVVAAGPFCTSDSLDTTPLNDIIAMVKREGPDILLLMGPFLDVNNSVVKTGSLPEDMTLQQFFSHRILQPLVDCVTSQRTQLLLMPSQRDAHHPFEVYPQPPFQTNTTRQDRGRVLLLPDPCTLSVNGVCVGATSTDILFHLSARTMFLG
jgi:DNA polymerase alpha subunit B